MEFQHDVSIVSNGSRDDQSISTTVRLTTDKYRSMPVITSEEMIQGHIPSPGLCVTNSIVTSSRERPPPLITLPRPIHRMDYADKESPTGSAWIRYNEHRIEQLQKRIDLMLQIDDDEQIVPTTATVTQRIDDFLMNQPSNPRSLLCHHHRSSGECFRWSSRSSMNRQHCSLADENEEVLFLSREQNQHLPSKVVL